MLYICIHLVVFMMEHFSFGNKRTVQPSVGVKTDVILAVS